MFTAEERIPIVANWQYQDSFENFLNVPQVSERVQQLSLIFLPYAKFLSWEKL